MTYTKKPWADGNRVYAVDINKWETGIDDAKNELATKLDASVYTKEDVLSKVKQMDGSGSGLDADLLDGQDGSYYATASALTTGLATKVDKTTYNASDILGKIKTVDGTGSELDADFLDGYHAGSFLFYNATAVDSAKLGGQAPSYYATATHTHGTYSYSSALPDAWVFSNISVTNGIVTGLESKSLTYADVGAAASWHNHSGVYLDAGGTAVNSNALGGQAPSYYATASALASKITYGSTVPSWLANGSIFVKI